MHTIGAVCWGGDTVCAKPQVEFLHNRQGRSRSNKLAECRALPLTTAKLRAKKRPVETGQGKKSNPIHYPSRSARVTSSLWVRPRRSPIHLDDVLSTFRRINLWRSRGLRGKDEIQPAFRSADHWRAGGAGVRH